MGPGFACRRPSRTARGSETRMLVDLSYTHYLPQCDYLITSHTARGDAWLIDNVGQPAPDDLDDARVPNGSSWVKTRGEFTRLYEAARADGLMVGDILITLEMTDDEYENAQERARERGISLEEAVKETVLAGLAPAEQAKKLIDEFLRKRAEAKGQRK